MYITNKEAQVFLWRNEQKKKIGKFPEGKELGGYVAGGYFITNEEYPNEEPPFCLYLVDVNEVVDGGNGEIPTTSNPVWFKLTSPIGEEDYYDKRTQ
jgi:hypothetical protein